MHCSFFWKDSRNISDPVFMIFHILHTVISTRILYRWKYNTNSKNSSPEMDVFFTKVSGMQIGNPCNMNFHFLVISQIKRKHLTVTSLRLSSHAILNLSEITMLSKGRVYVFKKPHLMSFDINSVVNISIFFQHDIHYSLLFISQCLKTRKPWKWMKKRKTQWELPGNRPLGRLSTTVLCIAPAGVGDRWLLKCHPQSPQRC